VTNCIAFGTASATHEIVEAAANSIRGAVIANCSLNRRVAVGVVNGGQDGTDAWVILDFASGAAQAAEIRHCSNLSDPDAALDVAIVFLAKVAVWTEIGQGGFPAALAATDARKIFVSGKLAYFIRHVRSSVDLPVLFGEAYLVQSKPQVNPP
jgi:hypothetical protein